MRFLPLLFAFALLASAEDPTPGRHDRIPCTTNASLTYNLWLPKLYAEQPTLRLPVLFVSDAGGNPNLGQFEAWGERQGVILVAINDSRNGDWAPIHAAQTAVLTSVTSTLRISRLLRFAVGGSGAAWASAELARKAGEDWGGILFLINSQRETPVLKSICCAYLAGEKDTAYSIEFVRGDYEAARSAGNPVRLKSYPDKGHEGMPIEDQIIMLDWMLERQRFSHPLMKPDELKTAQEQLAKRIEEITAMTDSARCLAACEPLLQCEAVAKSKTGQVLRSLWCRAALTEAAAITDPIARFRAYDAIAAPDRSPGLDAAGKKELQKALADLRKDKVVKGDIDSRAALTATEADEAKAGRTKGKLKDVLAAYQAISKRWPGTEAAGRAEAGAARVMALLQ